MLIFPRPPASALPRLLIVEDDDATRLVCARFFRKLGLPGLLVDEARNGEEAIAALERERYDAVLSDYRMGLVSGIDVLRAALEKQPDAARFLMSGFADPMIVTAAHEHAKVHAFIEKPMSNDELEAALREVARHVSRG